LAAVVYVTHAPLQRLNPVAHWNPQPPSPQEGCALATVVAHAWAQPLQLAGSDVVSMQVPLQFVGALGGQFDVHACVLSTAAHTIEPLQVVPQPPQFEGVAGSTQPASHAIMPPSHPFWTTPPSPPSASRSLASPI
jgi:hypothetical protein